MKKSLLLGLTLAVGFGAAVAQTTTVKDPTIYENASFQRISADGKIIIAQFNGTVNIYNLETGENEEFAENNTGTITYTIGLGNCLSADGGILVLNYPNEQTASYYEGGEFYELKVPNADYNNHPNGITPDGKRICGTVGAAPISLEESNTMQLPVYWDRNEDGTYGECVILPYPKKDFFGQNPQYVTAIAISSDGKVILGQMVSGNGMMEVPVIYKQDDNGDWTYTLPTESLFNPDGIPAVEDPGEAPEQPKAADFLSLAELEAYDAAMQQYLDNIQTLKYPQYEDFMTEEELQKYQEALEAYYENWTVNPYPQYEDYMTQEEIEAYKAYAEEYAELTKYPEYTDFMSESEKAEYDAALADWSVLYDEWDEKFMEYAAYQEELLASSPNFLFNSVKISTDNKKYICNLQEEGERDPWSWGRPTMKYVPCAIDVETGELEKYDLESSVVISGVADNGIILAGEPLYSNMMGYVIKNDGSSQTIIDYIGSVVPEYKSWIEKNMTHEVVVGLDEDYEEIYEEVTFGGMPIATPDMSTVATWVLYPDTYEIEGVVYDLKKSSVVSTISVAGDLAVGANGTVIVPAGFATLDVYGLNGACVKSVNAPKGVISLDVPAGVYVVKGTREDGSTSILKVAAN